MKRILIIPIIVLCGVLILAVLSFYDANNKFDQTNLSYYGINGKEFYPKINATGLDCKIEPNNNLKNGDVVSLDCCDNLTGLFRFSRDFTIEGLFSDEFDSSEFLRLISSKISNGTAYAKTDDRGIHLLVLSNDNSNYSSTIYDNLYFTDDMLYQVSDIGDRSSYSTTIVPTVILSDIRQEHLEDYLKIYLDDGYEKIGL